MYVCVCVFWIALVTASFAIGIWRLERGSWKEQNLVSFGVHDSVDAGINTPHAYKEEGFTRVNTHTHTAAGSGIRMGLIVFQWNDLALQTSLTVLFIFFLLFLSRWKGDKELLVPGDVTYFNPVKTKQTELIRRKRNSPSIW